MLISILMGLCKGNLWPKIILIMICLDISSLFFGLYYDFSHCIYIGIYISFDLNKAPRSCLATAGRAPEAVPFQTFKCMLHIFRRIFQKSLISYRDFHAISEHGPSNRIRTSDLRISIYINANYSPPLYQLSYRGNCFV